MQRSRMLDAGVVNVHVYFAFSAQCIFKALVIKIQLQAVQVTLSLCVFICVYSGKHV